MVTAKRARVLLADDHALVSAGISKLLENDFDLLGTVADGRALVAAVRERHPDVILLDISMPVLNGLEAARQIRKESPMAKLIFVTVHSDTPYVIEAFRDRGSPGPGQQCVSHAADPRSGSRRLSESPQRAGPNPFQAATRGFAIGGG